MWTGSKVLKHAANVDNYLRINNNSRRERYRR